MAGYIGSKAVSVNTTSATISDDLSVGDDLTVTDDATIGGTALVTGVLTTTAATVFNGGFVSNANSTISGDLTFGDGHFLGDGGGDNLHLTSSSGENILLTSAGGIISFNDSSSEYGRFTTDGALGIGVNDPDATLDISKGANALGILRVTQRVSGAAAYGLDVGLDATTGDPVFSRIVNDTVTEALRITRSSGLLTAANGLTLTDGNLTVATAHGIAFGNASGNTKTIVSNLLDDYEEGTFTPTDVSGASLTLANTTQGSYTKIGNLVNIQCKVVFPATSNTADTKISVPFAIDDRNEYFPTGKCSGNGNTAVSLVIGLKNTSFVQFQNDSGGTSATNNLVSEANFNVNLTYQTAT